MTMNGVELFSLRRVGQCSCSLAGSVSAISQNLFEEDAAIGKYVGMLLGLCGVRQLT